MFMVKETDIVFMGTHITYFNTMEEVV